MLPKEREQVWEVTTTGRRIRSRQGAQGIILGASLESKDRSIWQKKAGKNEMCTLFYLVVNCKNEVISYV